ncbi:putative cytokinin riboside 5'-monophosphate phosphoribohydrolase LOGL7 [Mycena venus]|uniref:Putative cytokinin riboside 5'-monophosphate phosphoribohydrolase LOGL7 n=1 Tax=Mycena venus TaxID=2733690 RepID=A0A8H6XIS7_9AGAR|nr:putative cytokinin riboside 5'-monophosphate phosphoribohydrolase LOGL7 [Mycena venus]
MAIEKTIPKAVAVYCASTLGKKPAYRSAAASLGSAIARAKRGLVYGGGIKGIMGVVASAVLEGGGSVTGIVPFAIAIAGGEGKVCAPGVEEVLRQSSGRVEMIVVNSMADRKTEMAKRVDGFFGLPGGFGTLDEILEVITWTQIGFHSKPIILLNVLSYFEPLRQLIRQGIEEGFIPADNESFVIFVNGPDAHSEHENFDWGTAGLAALASWDSAAAKPLYVWKEMGVGN